MNLRFISNGPFKTDPPSGNIKGYKIPQLRSLMNIKQQIHWKMTCHGLAMEDDPNPKPKNNNLSRHENNLTIIT